MQLQEIVYSDVDKQIKIDQGDYHARKANLLKNRLPFTIDVVKDGRTVSLAVVVMRDSDKGINVNVIDVEADQLVGRLYLARPDIFPGAYYVTSIGILPAYQKLHIGQLLYDGLMQHVGIAFVGTDQSEGARKMWTRLGHMPGNRLYAMMLTQQNGNFFYECVSNGTEYTYLNYQGEQKPIKNGSNFYIILAKTGGKMATYVEAHMELSKMRWTLSMTRRHADPFGSHIHESSSRLRS